MSLARPSYQLRPKTSLMVWLLRFVVLSVIGATMLALLLLVLLTAWQVVLQDRVVPGVTVGGVDLSGMTEVEAASALNEEFSPLADILHILRDGERTWQARASELGLRIATEDMLGQAFAVGHAGDALDDILAQSDAWFSGEQQPLQLLFDENIALDYLRALASQS